MSSRSEPVKSPPPERLPIERDPIRWALQENNHDWYRELVEHSRDLLCVHDLQGRLLSVNPVPARLLGYSVDEMLQIPMREMIVPEYRDLFDLYLKQIEYDGEAEGLMVVLSRTGERQVWEFHNTLHSARMGPPVVLGLAHDITERRKAEAQFHALLEAAPDAMIVADPEARMMLVNAQVESVFGYQRKELLGQKIEMLVPERLRERHCELRNDFLRAPHDMPTRVGREFLALHKDGHEFPVEINLSPLQTAEGLLVTSAIRDITERKQAEEALRISEREQHRITQQLETERARLIEAQAVAKVGSWETELPSLDITWSEQTHRIFETDPSYFHPRRPDFVELVHPEDRAKVDAAFEASLENGAPSTVEYRIVMADGRVKVLEEHWKVFHDGQGRPARLMGTCQDITERKLAEAALRESEDRYRDLVEHSQDLLCTHDLTGKLLSANPAPARILGYEVSELLQIPMREFVAPEYREQFDRYLARIRTAGVDKGFLAVMTRSGERRIWEYNNTLRTEGVPFPIVRGMSQDISERKRADKSLQLFRMLVDQSSDAIEVVDPETLRFIDVNGKACSDLGYSREELLSMSVPDISPNAEALNVKVSHELRSSGSAIFESFHRRKDG